MTRRKTRALHVGDVALGGGAPISVQTMANADPHDAAALAAQIARAAAAGAQIVRLTVPDFEAARVLGMVRAASPVPLVADVHFDHRLALAALEAGVDALRLNPGNVGGAENVRAVARAAAAKGVPVRVGVNGGSLEKDLLEKHGAATAEALAESALRHVALLEDAGFRDVCVSAKASDVARTIAVYRLLAAATDCPLHVGVTEAGTLLPGAVRSAVALGILLAEGIGDTIRVSLSAPPEQEVRAGLEILRSLGLAAPGPRVTSCPTCGRTQVDVARVAEAVEAALPPTAHVHVAVMGCVVNGPGEAREADVALCGGRGAFALYVHGAFVRKVPEAQAVEAVCAAVKDVLRENREYGKISLDADEAK